jgi:hypothetical protein
LPHLIVTRIVIYSQDRRRQCDSPRLRLGLPFRRECCCVGHAKLHFSLFRGSQRRLRPLADQSGFQLGDSRRLRIELRLGNARRNAAVTCTGVQTPPRAVATLRALSALAMAGNNVAPLAFICSITWSTLNTEKEKRPAGAERPENSPYPFARAIRSEKQDGVIAFR